MNHRKSVKPRKSCGKLRGQFSLKEKAPRVEEQQPQKDSVSVMVQSFVAHQLRFYYLSSSPETSGIDAIQNKAVFGLTRSIGANFVAKAFAGRRDNHHMCITNLWSYQNVRRRISTPLEYNHNEVLPDAELNMSSPREFLRERSESVQRTDPGETLSPTLVMVPNIAAQTLAMNKKVSILLGGGGVKSIQ